MHLAHQSPWDLFAMLGWHAAHGRTFTAEDDRPGAEPVVILGDEIFQRRYRGDPSIVGKRVLVNARPHTVVGVMPPNFEFPKTRSSTRRSRSSPTIGPGPSAGCSLARLKDGVTIEQAGSDSRRSPRSSPGAPRGQRRLERRRAAAPRGVHSDDVELIIWTMMGAVTLVLLIACANIANLLIARASVRQREISIRARSARRWRIVRQLVTEAILLGLMAAPIGMVLAVVGLRWLDSAIPGRHSLLHPLGGRSPRDACTIVVSIVTGIIFGLAPAFQATRVNLHESLKEEAGREARAAARGCGTRSWSSRLLRRWCCWWGRRSSSGASRQFRSATPVSKAAPLMTMRFFLTGDAYQTPEAGPRTVDIVRRVESLPGVRAAFASNLIPLGGGGGGGRARPSRAGPTPKGEEPNIGLTAVTPHLHRTLDVRILRGRDFTDAEADAKRRWRSSTRRWRISSGRIRMRSAAIQGGGCGHQRRVVHGHRRRRRLLPQRDG